MTSRLHALFVRDDGNALFLVLIGVVLFAALSYAVTLSTTAGGGDDAGKDSATIVSSQLIQYTTSIEQAIMKMRIDGATDTNISFHAAGWGHNDYQHTPPAGDRLKVFHPAGGGISWMAPPDDANDGSVWRITGALEVTGIGTTCGAASCAEIVIILPNISKSVCDTINEKMGITSGQETVAIAAIDTEFTGTYSAVDVIGDDAMPSGTATACFEGSGAGGGAASGTYHFFHVLYPR
jgi:hypothetical protein